MIKRSIPLVDEKIKALFREVEDAAKGLCKASKGTLQEDLGKSAYEGTKGLGRIESPIDAERYLGDLIPLLQAHCSLLPEMSRAYFGNLIDSMESTSLEQKFQILKDVLQVALVYGEQRPTIIQAQTNIEKANGPVLSGSFCERNVSKNEENH